MFNTQKTKIPLLGAVKKKKIAAWRTGSKGVGGYNKVGVEGCLYLCFLLFSLPLIVGVLPTVCCVWNSVSFFSPFRIFWRCQQEVEGNHPRDECTRWGRRRSPEIWGGERRIGESGRGATRVRVGKHAGAINHWAGGRAEKKGELSRTTERKTRKGRKN